MKNSQKNRFRLPIYIAFAALAVFFSNCKKTVDPPIANISVSATLIMAGQSVTFTDASTGAVTSRAWQISGGTPSISTEATVTSQFNTEGTFVVQLTATNEGGSTTKTISVVVKPLTYLHITSTANISGGVSYIDNPVTNNKPNVVIILTNNWVSGAAASPNKIVGVFYFNGKWGIFNEDGSDVKQGIRYNVMVKEPTDKALTLTPSSVSGNYAYLNHASLNGNPNARLLVTQNFAAYNNFPIGVWYNGSNWVVFNQNGGVMPSTVKFNVVIDDKIFVATATSPVSNYGDFSNAATDSQADALIFATQYWTAVNNGSEIGVWYNNGRWSIFNQNASNMPLNAKFMVYSNKS
jgi:PKD repeat protein